jgi:hypothetical protein
MAKKGVEQHFSGRHDIVTRGTCIPVFKELRKSS